MYYAYTKKITLTVNTCNLYSEASSLNLGRDIGYPDANTGAALWDTHGRLHPTVCIHLILSVVIQTLQLIYNRLITCEPIKTVIYKKYQWPGNIVPLPFRMGAVDRWLNTPGYFR
jgi:hypothetical protein